MQLDFFTLMTVMAVNLLTLSAALPVLMGNKASSAARSMQAGLLLQALGWVGFLASPWLWDQVLSTLAVGCHGLALWMVYRTLTLWLGPRPFARLILVLVVAAPVGYTLGFGHYAWRVGWSNFMLAVILLIVARATVYPVAGASRRWRGLLLGCLVVTAIFTAARGYLGAFTDQYTHFAAPHPVNLAAVLFTNAALVLSTVALLVAWRAEAEKKLRTLAITDGLTSLINRRGFTAQGKHMLGHAIRHQLPLTALMMDLDHFKKINDTKGHATGDKALVLFARLLRETCRSGDLVARLGGEEFGVLLLHNNAAAGNSFDRRLRKRLKEVVESELGFSMTHSAGMAVLAPGETSLSALMARADAALYRAKTEGRARLVAA